MSKLIPILLLSAMLPGQFNAHAQSSRTSREYEIKAAMLYHFTQFVTWDPTRFKNSGSPIQLCLLMPVPFGPFIEQLVAGHTVGKDKRHIDIVRHTSGEDLSRCHLLFVSRQTVPSNSCQFDTLIITEDQSIEDCRAHINLYTQDDSVRFEINLRYVQQSRFQISSKLLSLARIVDS